MVCYLQGKENKGRIIKLVNETSDNITRKFSSLVTINFEVKFAVNSHHCGTLKSDFLYAMFVVDPPPNSHASYQN